MRFNLKHYIFGGVDLLVGKDNKVYFIEANSAPFGLPKYKEVYGRCDPLYFLAKILPKNKKIAMMYKLYGPEAGLSMWAIKEMQKYVPKLEIAQYEHNLEKLEKGDGSLLNDDFKKIKPDIVLRQHAGRPYAQEKAGIRVINPTYVLEVTKDKAVTNKLVGQYAPEVHRPAQFKIKNLQQAKKIIKQNKELFKHGFVLKPRFGTCSVGVNIFNSLKQLKNLEIKEPCVLEQRIMPSKEFKEKFFDLRCFAIDGKFVGAICRVSSKPVTGISAGGFAVKLPPKFKKQIKKATEAVVKAVDIGAEEFRLKKT